MNLPGILVMAKAPIPGQVKTRLCPPCTPDEAAEIAQAALRDTLDAAMTTRRPVVLALAGEPGAWLPPGVRVVAQIGGSFNERLAAAWTQLPFGGVQIGMDTPQVTASQLDAAMAQLTLPRTDAVLGPAVDGGWWAIGFRAPEPTAFHGVPMSRQDTCVRQLARLEQLGLATTLLPTHRDVDEPADVAAVAALFPDTRFAEVATRLLPHVRITS